MAEKNHDEYQETIDQQRSYLLKLQEAFNKHCDQLTAESEDQLKKLPLEDTEGREQVMAIQKQKLQQALSQLRQEVTNSTIKTRQKLEAIISKREEKELEDLEKMLNEVA
ncbi:MAG: hypothetical protein R3B71_05610 [Candidatus Gracilibacteria bacterium]